MRLWIIFKTRLLLLWKYRKDFRLLRQSIRLVEKFLSSNKIIWDETNDFSKVVIVCLVKNLQTANSIYLLCHNGFGKDAILLSRTMFESLIDFSYMHKNKKFVQDYIDFTYLSRIKAGKILENSSVNGLDKQKIREKISELEGHWKKIKHRFIRKTANGKEKVCNRWSCKDLRTMTTEVNLQEPYDFFYVYASDYIHSTAMTVNDYILGKNKNSIVIKIGASETLVHQVLSTTSSALLDILSIIEEEYKIGFDEKLIKLSKQLQNRKKHE